MTITLIIYLIIGLILSLSFHYSKDKEGVPFNMRGFYIIALLLFWLPAILLAVVNKNK